MKNILLTFDIEEFPSIDFNIPISKEESYNLGYKAAEKVLEFLKEEKVKVTCFVTYEFARRYKKLIKEFEKIGCEIACHGFDHQHRYNKMKSEEAFMHIKKAKEGFKKLGFNISGFRAPQMSHPDYKIIKKAGFKYDSSLHPTWIPGYYNNFFKTRKIQKIEDLIIIPLSVAPIIRLPLGWIFFRNFGLIYEKIVTKLNFIDLNFTNIYLHPWEFLEIKKYEKYMGNLIVRNTGSKLTNMLKSYINWSRKNHYKFNTIKGYLSEINLK
jgi:peptidoglycan/xylan/chitin deacetylase (PgdA/CDA1 family)